MICSICGINESSFSISVRYNGKATNVHLCSQCIRNFGLDPSDTRKLVDNVIELIEKNIIKNLEYYGDDEFEEEILSFDNLLGIIASNKFGDVSNNLDDNKTEVGEDKNMKNKDMFCPYCGTSLEEIVGSSHLGCVGCFEFFRDKIKHRPAKFEGRVPRVYRKIYIQERLRDYLSNKMMVEVVRENFEEASKIRKLISKIVK